MTIINLKKQLSFLTITPITNLDFESNEVIDNTLLDELKVEPKTQLSVFNNVKNISESVIVSELKEHHWYMKDGILHKIIHIL